MRTVYILLIGLLLYSCNKNIDLPESNDWPSTIDYFSSTLESNHKNLFFQLPRDEFYAMTDTLKQQCDTLSDVDIILGLSGILAKVGDAHTCISLRCNCISILPFQFLPLSDGYFCINAPLNYNQLVGEVLESIDGMPMETVEAKLSEIIPHENESKLQQSVRSYIISPEILYSLKIISNNQQITYQTKSGLSVSVKCNKVYGPATHFFVGKELPYYLKDTETKYWFIGDTNKKLVYVQYNSCSETSNYTFREFNSDVFDEIERIGADKLVIDLRWNGGGNSTIFNPMLRSIKNNDLINRNKHLYVVIGKATFSSALLNALSLKDGTNAILIGEPTGGKPNHYGEVKTFQLNKLGVVVQYSTRYFKNVKGDPPSLEPDITIETSSNDMISLTDPVLEYIFK